MTTKTVKSEDPGTYYADSPVESEAAIIAKALLILRQRMHNPGPEMTSPDAMRGYLKMKLCELEHEVFGMVLLDNRHRVITSMDMFRGTVDGASVHPREVVKVVLRHNAVAVVMYHNHPSGEAEPSQADIRLTERLVEALKLIDVRVLDHLIIGSIDEATSFAERGLI